VRRAGGRISVRRLVTRFGLALALAWIATVVVLVHAQPAPGATDPAALAAAVAVAFRAHDAHRLEHLLATPSPDAAAALLAACGVAVVRAQGSDRLELLTADGRSCGTVPIAQHHNRWYIDPWTAPLR